MLKHMPSPNPWKRLGSTLILLGVVGGCGLMQIIWPSEPNCPSCNVEQLLKTQGRQDVIAVPKQDPTAAIPLADLADEK